jgi:CubicO group peptidase (beta-lactamase class C family)
MPTIIAHELQRTTPEQQSIASSAVLRFVEALESQMKEIHSFMLLRHGSVAAEGWWSPYAPEVPHMLFSLSKSFTATAVGLAVSEGRFAIDDPVTGFFPDETPAEISDHLAAMRVRHLLTMSTGHGDDTWSVMLNRADGNWIKGFLGVPVVHAPGTHFLYNTGASYMLSAIVQKTTGMKMVDYLEPRLFAPLGITGAMWEESPQGINSGGIGVSLTTEGVARFGQLYLQKGMWEGTQVLPEAWVRDATAFQLANGDYAESDWAQGYGYQFWRCRHDAYRGDGVFGQFCIVMPQQDAMLAITAGVDVFDMQQMLDLVWEHLLPALGTDASGDDDTSQRLAEKLASLSLPPVQGQGSSTLAAQISGRTYAVDANDLNIETMALDYGEGGCVLRVETAAGQETIPCGYDAWRQGQTSLFNESGMPGNARIATSGAWTSDDSFTMIMRLVETPFFHTLTFHFAGDEMMIETRVNVSLEAPRVLLLTALCV